MIYSHELKIPKERVAILIGKGGETKTQIEEATKTKLQIDSEEGDVIISGEDAIGLYSAREIIKAIGRGFNPDLAQQLLKPEYMFEIITMADHARTKNDAIRLKGRVIGEGGKSRKIIEDLTECNVSVYGKTISVIGKAENVPIARRAIEALLQGSPHKNVYSFLEKQRRQMKRREFETKPAGF